MNIVQLHERVRYWLNYIGSPRYEPDDIDLGINVAVNQIQKEKYDKTKPQHHSETFESTQAVRDELREFIKSCTKDSPGMSMTDEETSPTLIPSLPSDYRYFLAIKVKVNDTWHPAYPMSRNKKNIVSDNTFRKPSSNGFIRCYYEEYASGIRIIHDFTEIEDFYLEYLKNPSEAFYGYEKDHTENLGVEKPFIVTMTPTSYKSTQYKIGEELETDAVDLNLDYGKAVIDYINPEFGSSLYEDIALRAAVNCSISSGNLEKAKLLKGENISL